MGFVEKWWMLEPAPGRAALVPGTDVHFKSLAEWLDAFTRLDGRKASSNKNEAVAAHMFCLPRSYIYRCADLNVLARAIAHVEAHQPPRGQRAEHPSTFILSELKRHQKQLKARIESLP